MSAETNAPRVTQSSVLICDGIPSGIPSEKTSKLTLYLKKLVLLKNGAELSDKPNNVFIFVDEETNATTGIAFIDFKTDESALTFKTRFPELKFDERHKLRFFTKREVDEFILEPEEYTPLEFKPIDVLDFKGWLKDERYVNGNECLSIFEYGKSISLGWCDPRIPTNVPLDDPQDFVASNLAFSPSGTFLYAITDKGLVILQPEIKKKFQFPHNGLTHITISPHDTYIATYSPTASGRKHVIVWDRRFTKGIKFFELKPSTTERIKSTLVKEKTLSPKGEDMIQFSSDEKYIARISEVDDHSIEIYTTPTLQLLNNKLVTFESAINKLSWAGSTNLLNNEQAHFFFYDVNKNEIIERFKIFSLRNAEFFWHPSGKKLVVKCTKGKRTAVVVFSIDKTITASTLELNAAPQHIEVNPVKLQFSILAYPNKKGGNALFPTLHVYDISSKEIIPTFHLPNVEIKSFLYSPNGQFIVLSGIGTSEPYLYFYNTEKMTMYKKVAIEQISYIQWDPVGLFLTAVRSYIYSPHAKNGFLLYDCFGNLKYDAYRKDFAGLLWRPQPTNLVGATTKDVQKMLKDCMKSMKEEDEQKRIKIEEEKKAKAEELMKRYRSIVKKNTDAAIASRIRAQDSTYKIITFEKTITEKAN
ncbi:Translation initiation factor beta propellor-like domain-containing protein [Entamoeba marina]